MKKIFILFKTVKFDHKKILVINPHNEGICKYCCESMFNGKDHSNCVKDYGLD